MPQNKRNAPASAPFLYKMSFKQSELEKQELIEYIDEKKIKKKVPVFDGTKGVESLLFLQEQFTKVCTQLQFDDEERFDQFEECLADGAEEHWANVKDAHPHTNQGFEAALRAFYLHYTTSDGRDIMKQVLEHHCHKPSEVSCREHQNRFETIVRRSNKLHGYGSPIDAFDTKQWYFMSYPKSWRNDWDTGGRLIREETTTLNSITEYMENRKAYYDAQSRSKPRDNDSKNGRNPRKKHRKSKHDKPTNTKDSYDDQNRVLCRKHNGAHPWIFCPDNPKSKNYKGNRDNGNNNGGGNNGSGSYYRGRNNRYNRNNYNRNGDSPNGNNSNNNNSNGEGFHLQQQDNNNGPPSTTTRGAPSVASSVTDFQSQTNENHFYDRLETLFNSGNHCIPVQGEHFMFEEQEELIDTTIVPSSQADEAVTNNNDSSDRKDATSNMGSKPVALNPTESRRNQSNDFPPHSERACSRVDRKRKSTEEIFPHYTEAERRRYEERMIDRRREQRTSHDSFYEHIIDNYVYPVNFIGGARPRTPAETKRRETAKRIARLVATDPTDYYDIIRDPESVSTDPQQLDYEKVLYSDDELLENFATESSTLGSPKRTDLVPSTMVVLRSIQGQRCYRLLRALLDSGSSNTLIHQRAVSSLAVPNVTARPRVAVTPGGEFDSSKTVMLRGLRLPEFSNSRSLEDIQATIFDAPSCRYDVILGRDVLAKTGIALNFTDSKAVWDNRSIDFKSPDYFQTALAADLIEDEEQEEDFEIFATDEIKKRKYEAVTPDEVIAKQTHLSKEHQDILHRVLHKNRTLFDGKLGRFPHRKVSIELVKEAQPVHKKAYSVPRRHLDVFRHELDSLVKDGVLERVGMSQWSFPTFIIKKKDNRVRWVSDFRELNKLIRRKPYPMPKIYDIMLHRAGYRWFTKIDVSMQFYCFELDERSSNMCTIVTPFGKYRYLRLPMGVKISPDIAQSVMEEILKDIDVEVYIDDVGYWSNLSFESHMQVVDTILQRLAANGLKCNPLKCAWGVKETDFLGYWMTPSGVKPQQDKIEAVVRMQAPTNLKQLRSFIGAVNFYKSMFPRRTHILHPLTALTGTKIFQWNEQHEKAFQETKAIIAQDCINNYADINQPFHIYTDASDYQMGAVIIQYVPDRRIISYWSKTLSPAQRNYNTMEKELLAVVMCVREYSSLLYGGVLFVYTDHRNLTFNTLSAQRVIRWRMFLEDYDITFKYIEGEKNVLADCYSRLPRMEKPSVGRNEYKGTRIDFQKITIPTDTEDIFHADFPPLLNSICDNHHTEVIECFLNLPTPHEMEIPIALPTIRLHQTNDALLNLRRQRNPNRYPIKFVGEQQLPIICYRRADENEALWRIALPASLVPNVIRWYHLVLGHAGKTRTYDTIRARFFAPNLQEQCEQFRCPDRCEIYKKQGPSYGQLPPREVNLVPWNQVDVDLIGPWKIKINDVMFTFNALTCIDPVTNLTEIVRINNKTSNHIAQKFSNCWLARYPRPNRCAHDKGNEFTGYPFQQLLLSYGIQNVESTVKNPQSNAICERMHQTVANILRSILHSNPPNDLNDANQLVDNALATCVHATRCAVNATLQNSPGSIVFQRDMLMDVPLLADLATIRDRRQALVDENLRRQNLRRRRHDYSIGDRVFRYVEDPDKLEPRLKGPYPIRQVYTNGTVEIEVPPGYRERINIRKLTPCRE